MRVFIDGEAGTTGLQIRDRLSGRIDVELLSIPAEHRKDPVARRALFEAAEAVILCLPDEAARDAAASLESFDVRVIDASSAHRVAPNWSYGFPELSRVARAEIATARRVANCGCYATGFIALVRPLVDAGLVPADWPITVNAVSGYTGGGRSMIAEFEDEANRTPYRLYGLELGHKHVAEMRAHARLEVDPLFTPAVGRFAQGMLVEVPLQLASMPGRPTVGDVHAALAAHYDKARFVEVVKPRVAATMTTLEPEALNGTNRLQLFAFGAPARTQARLVARLDNLGKGASGAAVQNLNIMFGLDETLGL